MDKSNYSEKFNLLQVALKKAIDSINDALIVVDGKENILYLNQPAKELFNIESNNFVGKNINELLPEYKNCLNVDYTDSEFKKDIIITRNGHKKIFNMTVRDIPSDLTDDINKIAARLIILHNVTKEKRAEEEIKNLSLKDRLTGLYNRVFFEEEVRRLDSKNKLPLSFIIGDINGLKTINDTFGSKEGNRLLIKVAEILKKCCREEDVIARWGGDEFAVLLPETSNKDVEEILNRIRIEFFKTRNHKVPINISFGSSTKKNIKQDMESIIREAEDRMYSRKLLERQSISSSIISSLERTLQEKSQETEEHTFRMRELALKLGNILELSEDKLNELSLLASLHDIGKIAISNDILMKKGKLTKKEWEMMKKHTEVGYNICNSSPQLAIIADAVLSHHEWWDGSGYPQGLKGEEIPLTARIISIADAYEVMTHDRAYKKAISKSEAINELKRCSGTQFDPNLIEIFINIVENNLNSTD
ncbi:MAG: diguanylate cyclase [Actinomycetota bacterium]|nr:diguanylate cyclase [Actinomycetota bacterium]